MVTKADLAAILLDESLTRQQRQLKLAPLLREFMKEKSEDGLEIDESTLYPLLRRLESQGLLVSQWREEDKRNKRFYRLSPDGEQVLNQLLMEWQRINTTLNKILQEA